MEEQDILILGSTGKLGRVLTPLLAENHNICAPAHHELDIEKDTTAIHNVFSPTILLNLVGYTDVIAAEDPANWSKVLSLNTWLPKYLSDGSLDFRTKIIHISTDYVYDGDTPNSKETDILQPFNKYGMSKALCDLKLLKLKDLYPNIYIIRTSFKPKIWPHPTVFADILTNADTTEVISKLICKFINHLPESGIYNIGTKSKSLYDLVRKNNPNVKKAYLDLDSSMLPLILKKNLTMDLTKFRKLNND